MDKEVLVQYCEMREEIKDLRKRIQKLDRFLENPPVVADVVTVSYTHLTLPTKRIV